VASGFLILSFYSVVAGWAPACLFKAVVGFEGGTEQTQSEFVQLANSPGPSQGGIPARLPPREAHETHLWVA